MNDEFSDDEILDAIIYDECDECIEHDNHTKNRQENTGINSGCLGVVLLVPAIVFLFRKICC